MKSKLLTLLGSVLLSGMAQAGGFQVNLQGQKQIGMGHTGTGLALDEASIFFNPGALSHLRENGVQLGASGIISKIAYQHPETFKNYKSDNPLGTPFTFYAAYGQQGSPLKFGLGVYVPFGSGVKWEDGWAGEDALRQLDLDAIFIQPTISYKISEKIGFGAGLVYARGAVNLQRRLPLQSQQGQYGDVELDGGASGWGFNAGLYLQPTEKLSVGVTYRSKVEMKVDEGDAMFNTPASVSSQFLDTKFTATLPLPSNITLGLGYKVTDDLTLALDVQRVNWSAYEELRFDYEQPINGSTFTASARNYEDVYIYRLGAQYKIDENLTVRAGGYYDNTPVQDGYLTAETPDANAVGLSTGVGYRFGEKFQVDASFLFIDKEERTDAADKSLNQAGTYKTKVYIPGLAVSYKF
ncbi:MAG: outer membrane protein transport protein [Hymenobacteraceae bacterium]|nr:outer membrane protein transport protein [Hymenobacteraceae bacterium]